MTHDLKVEAIAENLAIHLRSLLRALVVVAQEWLRAQARHAARKHDQAFVVFCQKVEVDPRLVVVALEEALGNERDQIAVADQVRSQERNVGFLARRSVEAAARRQIGFATDDRHELVVARGVVELERPEHNAVIGEGDARRALVGGAPAQRIHATCAIQERVFAMDVQVDERTHEARCFPGRPAAPPAKDPRSARRRSESRRQHAAPGASALG